MTNKIVFPFSATDAGLETSDKVPGIVPGAYAQWRATDLRSGGTVASWYGTRPDIGLHTPGGTTRAAVLSEDGVRFVRTGASTYMGNPSLTNGGSRTYFIKFRHPIRLTNRGFLSNTQTETADRLSLNVLTNGMYGVQIGTDAARASSVAATGNEWHTAVYSISADAVVICVDGLVNSYPGTSMSRADGLWVGRQSTVSAYNTDVATVGFKTAASTVSEILDIYNRIA